MTPADSVPKQNYEVMRWLLLIIPWLWMCNVDNTRHRNDIHVSEPVSEATDDFCISKDEKQLIQLINSYRRKKGLKSVPVSRAMSLVADKHVRELNDEIKDLTHSWVDCQYKSSNPKTYECMWNKPKEIAGYPDRGYECAFGQWGASFSPEDVLKGWQDSKGHNQIIVNKGIWKDSDWKAIGVAIYGNYAVLWLGETKDTSERPPFCD